MFRALKFRIYLVLALLNSKHSTGLGICDFAPYVLCVLCGLCGKKCYKYGLCVPCALCGEKNVVKNEITKAL